MPSAGYHRQPNIYSELRPRKSRTKTGCLPCRIRRKKCDEQKPNCQSCLRLQLKCSWPPESHNETANTRISNGTQDIVTEQSHQSVVQTTASGSLTTYSDIVEDELDDSEEAHETLEAELRQLTQELRASGVIPHQQGVDMAVSNARFDSDNSETAMLFDHFCSKTAPWLINGHSHDNPVLKFIVPLIATDELVLNTAMAASATHLAYSMPSIQSLAAKYYSFALRTLRQRLSGWVSKSVQNYKPLFAAILLLCHCEFLSGNTYGAALQHLRACHQFVQVALQHLHDLDHRDFVVFLVEHYGYFMLMANLRCCLQENNVSLGLEFSDTILPMIKNYPSFGSIFAFEPESIAFIPHIAQLAWQRYRVKHDPIDPAWKNTYVKLLEGISRGRSLTSHDTGAESFELENIISIKINTLLMLLHASFYDDEEHRPLLVSLLQPLIDNTVGLLADVDEIDACYGMFWSVLITGAYTQDPEQQAFIVQKLGTNGSNMSFFTRGIELLQRLWTEPNEPNYGLEGLEKTAAAYGVNVCIC